MSFGGRLNRGGRAFKILEACPSFTGVNDKVHIAISSAAAELLPSVGPPSSCMLKAEHPDAESIALMAQMPLILCGSVSRTHTDRNTLACDHGGERFKFQVGRVGAKGRGGSLLTVSCWERCLCRPLKGSGTETQTQTHTHIYITHTHTQATTWDHDTGCALSQGHR